MNEKKKKKKQDRGQSPVTTPRPELNPTIFSVPKEKIAFWPLSVFPVSMATVAMVGTILLS